MTEADAKPETEPPSALPARPIAIDLDPCPDDCRDMLVRAARRTLRQERRTRGSLAIAVVSDAEMRRQHERWLGRDTSTDVLTFDLRDHPGPNLVDGQIVVSSGTARRRARRRGIDWRRELALYVVHGCLHLCGYDDRESEAFERMHAREDEILSGLGLGRVFGARPRRPAPAKAPRSRSRRP